MKKLMKRARRLISESTRPTATDNNKSENDDDGNEGKKRTSLEEQPQPPQTP